MSKKNFKIARKPGQGNGTQTATLPETGKQSRARKSSPSPALASSASAGLTTRKTIEVPEDFFFRVKMRALERHILEKELWAEILGEYFKNHPSA
jgi:hypothetical protein